MNFPPIYSFPPLYTRQPNKLVRNKQIETWINIILEMSQEAKCWEVNKLGEFKVSSNKGSIFHNEEIQRSVPQIFINEVWKKMLTNNQLIIKTDNEKTGSINPTEFIDNSDSADFYILWKNIDAWGSLLLEWFETCDKLNKVVTFYELSEGDESMNWDFHHMPEQLLYKCLKVLVKRGRATMMKGDNNEYVAIKVV